jgi:Acyl-CoA dehydrogenase N terminal
MGYQAPVRDMQFIFDDVLEVDRYSNLEGFSDATKETSMWWVTSKAASSKQTTRLPFLKALRKPITSLSKLAGPYWRQTPLMAGKVFPML